MGKKRGKQFYILFYTEKRRIKIVKKKNKNGKKEGSSREKKKRIYTGKGKNDVKGG